MLARANQTARSRWSITEKNIRADLRVMRSIAAKLLVWDARERIKYPSKVYYLQKIHWLRWIENYPELLESFRIYSWQKEPFLLCSFLSRWRLLTSFYVIHINILCARLVPSKYKLVSKACGVVQNVQKRSVHAMKHEYRMYLYFHLV